MCFAGFGPPEEKSKEEYDQFKVGKKFVLNTMSLDIEDVNERAIKAMIKRIGSGEKNDVPVNSIQGRVGGLL